MMLNKTSSCLYTLSNDIYTSKNFRQAFICSNNSNTRKRCEICSKLTMKSPQRSTVFVVNFEHVSHLFTPFSSVSTVGFEQVNICWVPPYQFMNVEINYCCNYIRRCTKILVKWLFIKMPVIRNSRS